MQSSFETADLSTQQNTMNHTNSSSPSPVLPTFFNPQNQINPLFQYQQQHLTHHHHHHHHHHLDLFQQQQQQHQSATSQWQMTPLNFKLGLNGSSCIDQPYLVDQNLGFKSWQPEELSIRKEPFWKANEAKGNEGEMCKDLESKYRLYGELEAIYSLANIGDINNNKQTGSGSALTNENSPKNLALVSDVNPVPFGGSCGVNVGEDARDGVCEGSVEEEALCRNVPKRKRKRKRGMKKEEVSSSMNIFFEGLVKRVMDHQESMHKKYLVLIEKLDREWRQREEVWRCEEDEKHKRAAIAQEREHDLASKREALIVSYIEKITGQKIEIPSREQGNDTAETGHDTNSTNSPQRS